MKTREKRQWWAVTEFDVKEVTGYSCAPTNPNTWWCPEVGFSGHVGYHLFPTKTEALEKAATDTTREIEALSCKLERIRNQIKKASDPSYNA